jgi:hypothetical protein
MSLERLEAGSLMELLAVAVPRLSELVTLTLLARKSLKASLEVVL